MEYKQMSIAAFADKIKVNRSSMTHIFNGRNQPSLDIAKKILIAFPDINTEWLIMGMGEMTRAVHPKDSTPNPQTTLLDNMRQTELFATIDEDETEPEQIHTSIDSSTETIDSESFTVQVNDINEPVTPSPIQEEHSPIQPPVPVASGPKSRKSPESHNSTRESKRERISNSHGDKKLMKIVFFYDDRSFEEYFPS